MFKFLLLLVLFHIHSQLTLFQELNHSLVMTIGLKICSLLLLLSEVFLISRIVFERAFARVESP